MHWVTRVNPPSYSWTVVSTSKAKFKINQQTRTQTKKKKPKTKQKTKKRVRFSRGENKKTVAITFRLQLRWAYLRTKFPEEVNKWAMKKTCSALNTPQRFPFAFRREHSKTRLVRIQHQSGGSRRPQASPVPPQPNHHHHHHSSSSSSSACQ